MPRYINLYVGNRRRRAPIVLFGAYVFNCSVAHLNNTNVCVHMAIKIVLRHVPTVRLSLLLVHQLLTCFFLFFYFYYFCDLKTTWRRRYGFRNKTKKK